MSTKHILNIIGSLEQIEYDIKNTKCEIRKSILSRLHQIKLDEYRQGKKIQAQIKLKNMINEKTKILDSISDDDNDDKPDVKNMWEFSHVNDPKFDKFQKDNSLNNIMMDRLNSEIDFRLDPTNAPLSIDKAFD